MVCDTGTPDPVKNLRSDPVRALFVSLGPERSTGYAPLHEQRRSGLVAGEEPDGAATLPGREGVWLTGALGLREGDLQDSRRTILKRCRNDQRNGGRLEGRSQPERPLLRTFRREERQSVEPVGASRPAAPPLEAARQCQGHYRR